MYKMAFLTAMAAAFVIVFPVCSTAGDFKVSPLSIELDQKNKSGAVEVSNEGEGDLRVQLSAFEWTQDPEGKDLYTETSEILFFPKIAVLQQKGKRVIRVGIKAPPSAAEKTYRLFITEIPDQEKSETARIAIALRIGIPLFVKPQAASQKGEITEAALAGGELSFTVRNTGNVHFKIKAASIAVIDDAGSEVFSDEQTGWYLLNDSSRQYKFQIPTNACAGVSTLSIKVKTDNIEMEKKVDVDADMCTP